MRLKRRRSRLGAADIHFQEVGAGPPLILVHGLSASSRWWTHNIEPLAARFHVFIVDLIGFGNSRRRGHFVLNEAAALLARWIDERGLERASLIGHSMGGFIAADLAARFPERVDRLVLVDAAALPLGRNPLRNAFSLVHAARYMPLGFFPLLLTDALRAGPLTILMAAHELLTTDISGLLAGIEVPTLIVWGEHDKLVPLEMGRRLREALPRAEFVVVAQAGHNPMWDRPALFNEAVLHFLTDDTQARRAPGKHVATK